MTRSTLRSLVCGAALSALVAAQARKIFDDPTWKWWLVATTLFCVMVAFLTARLAPTIRIAIGLVASFVATAFAVRAAHGLLPGDVLSSLTQGGGDLLSGRWPAAATPVAIGFVVLVAALASTAAAQCTIANVPGPTRLLPPIALLGMIALLASQAGPPSARFLFVFVGLAAAMLWLAARDRQHRSETDQTPDTTRQPRRLALLSLAGLLLVPVAFAGLTGSQNRFDPRQRRSDPIQSEDDLSPLTIVDQLRTRTPDVTLFESVGTPVSRWRLVGLNRFDGRAWMAPANLRQASSRLVDQRSAKDAPGARSVTITVKALEGQWLPTPSGRTFEISVPVRTDGTVSSLLSSRQVAPGMKYKVIGNELGYEDTGTNTALADRTVPASLINFEIPPSISTLASQIIEGAAGDRDRADRIATYLRESYSLDYQAPSGHSAGLVELFLTKTKRGRREQFVAGYALLAASVGLPVRIAVGFAPPDGSNQVMSSSAIAWPEVAFQGVGWQGFDPVPATEGKAKRGTSPQAPNAQVQTPVPTTAPQVEATTPPVTVPLSQEKSIVTRGRLFAVGLPVLLLIGAIAYLLAVLSVKKRQRSRRDNAVTTNGQVVGAFLNGTDRLMDLGVKLAPSGTDRELVSVAAQHIDAAHELAPLAELATEAAYSDVAMSPEAVDLAQSYLRSFETATASVPRKQLLLSKFSLRSVRKGFGVRPQVAARQPKTRR
jgi:transglutaminase-like putative cysteine protease